MKCVFFVGLLLLMTSCQSTKSFVDKSCEPEFTHHPDLIGGTICGGAEKVVHYDDYKTLTASYGQ